MTPAFAPDKTRRATVRQTQAATAAVTLLPLMALAFASLDSAIVYVAGQLLRAIGAR